MALGVQREAFWDPAQQRPMPPVLAVRGWAPGVRRGRGLWGLGLPHAVWGHCRWPCPGAGVGSLLTFFKAAEFQDSETDPWPVFLYKRNQHG